MKADRPPASPSSRIRVLDRLGATGSLVCAIHCALLPLVIALLPSLGIATWLGEGFERGFVTFATLLGIFTLVWGYRRHREVRALGMLIPGLAALWIGVLYDAAAPRADSACGHDDARRHAGRHWPIWPTCGSTTGHVHDASCAH